MPMSLSGLSIEYLYDTLRTLEQANKTKPQRKVMRRIVAIKTELRRRGRLV